ncbi:dickkopf-related protein 3-like isoform X1 [Clavelina lepadiformis]|uniref:dickkopf-related protein 3-like isoform X1 n=2 Tax=Clavelina lepadiformis TaxID=159417 RepID=UPI004042C5CA
MVGVLLNLAFCGLMIETALCSPYSRLAGSSSSSNGLYNNNDNGFYDIPMEEDVQNQLINEETKLLQDLLVSDLLEDLKEVGAADGLDNNLVGSPVYPLIELNNLEDAFIEEEDDDGKWLDDVQEVINSLPANYHNSSEYQTQIGNENVDVQQTINKETDDIGNEMWLSDQMQVQTKDGNGAFACSLANPCNEDEYCYKTDMYSECLVCLEVGEQCIDDAQCCSDNDDDLAHCVAGACAAGVKSGTVDTICEVAEDCDEGLCCATVQGYSRKMCKRFARLNERCSVETSVKTDVYIASINYYCPCVEGLKCQGRKPPVYNFLPVRYRDGQFCVLDPGSIIDKFRPSSRQNNQDMLDSQPIDQDLLDLEARLENENDQRNLNQGSSQQHHNAKKAMEMEPVEFMM